MKDAARLLLYLGGVVVLGALVAPPLFSAGRNFPFLAGFDFESYFHRALLLAAVILLWPLWRSLRLRSWHDLGLERNSRAAADVGAGLIIAGVPLLCCGAALLVMQVYSLRSAFLWSKMPTVFLAATIVPVVEEAFFRGLLLGLLLRSGSRLAAVILTAALFSIIHFLKAPEHVSPNESIHWFSGFVSIANSFWQFADPILLAAGFLTLFAIGCILADARIQTRSLWLPIGLHAGWIFTNGVFSKAAHRELLALPWLGKDLLVGIVPLILALASWALMRGWVSYGHARSLQSISRAP